MKVIWQEFVNDQWVDGESQEMTQGEALNFEQFLYKQVVAPVRWVGFCA